ncbi:MAG: hypothetical protein ACM3JH_07910 [Acidithiobacillales bacterium]
MKLLILAAVLLVPAIVYSSGHGEEKALLKGVRRLLVSVKTAPELTSAEISASALGKVLEMQLSMSGVEVAKAMDASDATLLVFLNAVSTESTRGSRHWVVHVSMRLQQPAQLLRNASIFRGGTWHRSTMFWIHPEDEMSRAIKQRVTYLADLLVSDLATANGRSSG